MDKTTGLIALAGLGIAAYFFLKKSSPSGSMASPSNIIVAPSPQPIITPVVITPVNIITPPPVTITETTNVVYAPYSPVVHYPALTAPSTVDHTAAANQFQGRDFTEGFRFLGGGGDGE